MEPSNGKKYPDPVELPSEVLLARRKRYQELYRSSVRGIFVRVFIAIISMIAALMFGSAALFMDSLSTSLDILSSIALIISFKFASKPPDQNHPFGHGRFEPLAGFQLGLILLVLGGGMLFYNAWEIKNAGHAAIHPMLFIVPLISMVLLEVCYQSLRRTAEKEESPALAADAVHYRIDSITSAFATLALVLGSYTPYFSQIFDHIGAALIAVFMIFVGINAVKKNLNQILDRLPDKEYFLRIQAAAMKVEGVKGTEKIRMQLFGPDAHVDIDVEVEPELTVETAHAISQLVRVEIQKELPQVQDVIVHIEPFYPNDHVCSNGLCR